MYKEMSHKLQEAVEIAQENVAFPTTGEATKYIGKFIKGDVDIRDKEKPVAVNVKLPNTEIRMFGYKEVSTIRHSDFLVHICGGNYERGFTTNFAKDMCMEAKRILKKTPQSSFDENLIDELVKSKGKLEKMKGDEFKALVAVFSALDEKHIKKSKQKQSLELRLSSELLNASSQEYYKQLKAIVLLNELEKGGLKPKDAVYKVLETMNTRGFLKACVEYGFEKVEHPIASDITTRESTLRSELDEFVNKWEKIDNPESRDVELKGEVKKMGSDICNLAVRRRIFNYNASIKEAEQKMESGEKAVELISDEFMRGEYQKRLDDQKKDYSRETTMRSNLEKTLKLMDQMVANESAKP